MNISVDRIFRNLKNGLREQIEVQKTAWRCAVPYFLGGALCSGLGQLAAKQPPEMVAKVVSLGLYAGSSLFAAVGAYKVWKGFENMDATLEGRKVEYVQISKKELKELRDEIERLKKTLPIDVAAMTTD